MGTVLPMPHLKRFPIPAALALTAVLAGCGSSSSSKSSGVSAGAYVKTVCQAVGPFEKDVVRRSSALNLATINNPAQGKTALKGFLSAVAADTGKALADLKAGGTPDVKNGKGISGAIVGAFSQLDTTMSQAVKQADNLSTTDPSAFKAGAQKLGNTVRSSMTNIGTNLQSSTLKSPDLEQAAAKEPACKSLGSSSGR
jgi:hypothetical protein